MALAGARLGWVGLVSSDPAATAAALERDLGLARADLPAGPAGGTVPVLAVGAAALAVFPVGHPMVSPATKSGVDHVALCVEDLVSARRAAGEAGVGAAGEPEAGLADRRWLPLRSEATAGVRTYLAEPIAVPPARSGPVERLDHVGVASADNAAVVDAFVRGLGFALESTQTDVETRVAIESFTSDKYGVVYQARPPEVTGSLRVAFITVGDCELECLQDADPAGAAAVERGQPGTTRQDRGAIARYVQSRGPGLHHLAFKVADIDGTLDRLGRAGHALIDRAGRPGSRRARIGFVHPRSLGGILVHLVERTPL